LPASLLDLALGEILVAIVPALNFEPSMATLAFDSLRLTAPKLSEKARILGGNVTVKKNVRWRRFEAS